MKKNSVGRAAVSEIIADIKISGFDSDFNFKTSWFGGGGKRVMFSYS
jgi:hypothetical protein